MVCLDRIPRPSILAAYFLLFLFLIFIYVLTEDFVHALLL